MAQVINVISAQQLGNYEAFLAPLWINRAKLTDAGIHLRFSNPSNAARYEAHISICLSRLGDGWPTPTATGEQRTEATSKLLVDLKRTSDKVFWFDTSDSSGSNQFRHLPEADKFLKAYLLTDLQAYQTSFYRDRAYTDYYHRTFNVVDQKPPPTRVLPKTADLSKIQLGWSTALGDFGPWAQHIRRIRQVFPSPFLYSARFTAASTRRDHAVNMRFGANYNRATIAFQRQQLLLNAAGRNIPTLRLSRTQYLSELQRSKVAVSPFGWGEVCFRDYEIILGGALLVKPDMSHMKTWPPLYVLGETYIPFKWDFSDFDAVLDDYLLNVQSIAIAEQAQAIYRHYLFERDGREAFCQHFIRILND